MSTNLVDRFLNNVILNFVTKDEWHTLVIGFFDGLSFNMQGKWCRKAFGSPKISVENVVTEKLWYYKAAYVAGELSKLALVVVLIELYGVKILAVI